ncbi:MAG: hypothetical protein IIB14_04225 [Chloroflexi bacterium]|nr:hypothetical protein [Chloroflexota bacterium]
MNEPSHFSNPIARRDTKEHHVREFEKYFRSIFEEQDGYLILAAVNEIGSNEYVRAVLGEDADNTPGVIYDAIVRPEDIEVADGQFSIKFGKVDIKIIPDSKEVPVRWKKSVVMVQHSQGMSLLCRTVTDTGRQIDISNFDKVLEAFASDPHNRMRLIQHIRRLGYELEIKAPTDEAVDKPLQHS